MSRSKTPRPDPPRSLFLTPQDLASITRHAESVYPEEACGLIVGSAVEGGRYKASRVESSPNFAEHEKHRRFEIDPALRLRLERELRGTDEAVIGHYHSHPDHPAEPSPRDLDQAHEPELIWLIVAVERGRVSACRAFWLDREGRRSHEVPLHHAIDGASSAKARSRRAARKSP